MLRYFPLLALTLACLCAASRAIAQDAVQTAPVSASTAGARVSYELPADRPLPKTYRVTLAVIDPKNPNWVISTFVAGAVRTVTAANQGKFTEMWDGLDENFMPVPVGTYGLKGIFMPAEKWAIDGQYHTIVPKLFSAGSSWAQTPSEDTKPNKIEGDPVDSPLSDVDVQPDGKGVVYFQYLENGTNAFLTDFTRPIGYDQIITGYPSGGVGGGGSACTDGKQIWILGDTNGQFILHADGTPFGTQSSQYCHNVSLPEGWVTGLAAWSSSDVGHGVLFVSEHGSTRFPRPDEGATGAMEMDQVVALDGNDAHLLAKWPVERPLSVKVRGGRLYVLHSAKGRFEVLSLPLDAGWSDASFSRRFTVPAGIVPYDVEIDSHERIYLSDSDANRVHQFDLHGKMLRTYGRLKEQRGGTYDPGMFMAPEKLGCWTDSTGQDRLLVVEQAGPNRLSEWSGDSGRMIRQWVTPQTRANDGYAIDPRHPDTVYMLGQRDTLVRWKITAGTGQWTTNAVWKNVGTGRGEDGTPYFQGLAMPKIIYHGKDRYLAFGRGYALYHDEGDRWRPCAAIFDRKTDDGDRKYIWRDLNGDGRVQPEEYLPFVTNAPPGVCEQYFGDTWFDDLSLVCIGSYHPDVWRLAPTNFDRRGTPIFDRNGWTKLLTDEIFVARKAGIAPALRGGNELLTEGFDCAWASVAQGPNGSIYVDARSGPDFSSNSGSQFKLSRYDADGKGGFFQKWRVGRMAFQGNARPGEVYGSIYDCPPVNGLVGIVDSSRAGFEIYTTDGLYADTLFPDDHLMPTDQMGAYWQPGEYFGGSDYVDAGTGKIYLALGKTMPRIYEAQGWTTKVNPVQPLVTLDRTVTLTADEIATPPQLALQMRGGPAAARVAEFSPAPGGGPALDGSMAGWEDCDPITFGTGDRTVEARCRYDPDHLFIRWHARTNHKFAPKPLGPVEHLFAHDRGNDTLGLYLQGDPAASATTAKGEGRPGDVRFVFGIFAEGGQAHPEVLGMYPTWKEKQARPVTYSTPVGSARFERVALVPGVRAEYKIDDDGRGFVVAAAIPCEAIPGAKTFSGWHTEGNFDANFGGVDRFWWSNADGLASRETFDEPTEARFYPGSWSAIRFLPIDNLPLHSWMAIGPFGFAELPQMDSLKERAEIIGKLQSTTYPPQLFRDWSAMYHGAQTCTLSGEHKVSWNDVEIAADQLQVQKAVGWTGSFKGDNDNGVCFFVTHLYTPQAVEVRLDVTLPDGDHDLLAKLNGDSLPEIRDRDMTLIDSSKPLQLKAGWNELMIRYTYVWGGDAMAIKILADPAILWKLRISAQGEK